MFKERVNPRLTRSDSMDVGDLDLAHAEKRKLLDEDLAYIVQLCCDHVTYCAHLISLTKEVGDRKQYPSLIQLGFRTQEILAAELEVQEKRESLEQKKAEQQSRQIATTSIDKALQDVLDELAKLGPWSG